jgi:hypothetical protein
LRLHGNPLLRHPRPVFPSTSAHTPASPPKRQRVGDQMCQDWEPQEPATPEQAWAPDMPEAEDESVSNAFLAGLQRTWHAAAAPAIMNVVHSTSPRAFSLPFAPGSDVLPVFGEDLPERPPFTGAHARGNMFFPALAGFQFMRAPPGAMGASGASAVSALPFATVVNHGASEYSPVAQHGPGAERIASVSALPFATGFFLAHHSQKPKGALEMEGLHFLRRMPTMGPANPTSGPAWPWGEN